MNFHGKEWQDLMFGAQAMKKKVQTVVENIASSHQLTAQQMLVLFGINNNQVATVGDLTKELIILQGNASMLCKKMESMGLIYRERNKQDVRVVNLKLTTRGQNILESIIATLEQQYGTMIKSNIDFERVKEGFTELDKIFMLIEGEVYE